VWLAFVAVFVDVGLFRFCWCMSGFDSVVGFASVLDVNWGLWVLFLYELLWGVMLLAVALP